MRNLIIFGGSFDPPHNGHVGIATSVQQHFNFDEFIILPCKDQVLKKSHLASAKDRINMLQLAFDCNKKIKLDLREINRTTPSYMVETLQDFRNELGNQYSINLLLGMDSFLELPKWYKWKQILKLCNLLIVNRLHLAEHNIPVELSNILLTQKSHNPLLLLNNSHGFIAFYNAGYFEISSTKLRQQINKHEDIAPYVPAAVYNYIKQNRLY